MGLYLHAPVGEIERFDLHGRMRLHIAIPDEEWPEFEQSALLRQIRAYAGPVRITAWYADNAICCREITFYVPGRRWSEFQASPLCQALEAYVSELKTRYNPPKPSGAECKAESARSKGEHTLKNWKEDILLPILLSAATTILFQAVLGVLLG